jgi:hypothetical protein
MTVLSWFHPVVRAAALKEELAGRSFITRELHRLNFDVAPTRAEKRNIP